ncbi:MAG: cyclic-di-AMP receptor [Firmicutes bacterium]|nr:cyclic-di-AMP receptor [Bacillota bacterium]
MKLILAVVEDDDATVLMDSLIENNFSATKLASTGGFLLRGNTTLLIGVEDEQVGDVLRIIRRVCVRRRKLLPQTSAEIPTSVAMPMEVESGGAAVWVLDVDQFHKI